MAAPALYLAQLCHAEGLGAGEEAEMTKDEMIIAAGILVDAGYPGIAQKIMHQEKERHCEEQPDGTMTPAGPANMDWEPEARK